MNLERRTFFRLCSACVALLAGGSKRPARSAPQARRDAVRHRKNFVAFGARFGVPERAVAATLDRVRASAPGMIARLGEIGLEKRREADLVRAMAKRAEDIA